jgi:hypothetical protein
MSAADEAREMARVVVEAREDQGEVLNVQVLRKYFTHN